MEDGVDGVDAPDPVETQKYFRVSGYKSGDMSLARICSCTRVKGTRELVEMDPTQIETLL